MITVIPKRKILGAGGVPTIPAVPQAVSTLLEDASYGKVLKTAIQAGLIKLSETIQTTDFKTTSDGEKTLWNGKEIAIHRGTTAPSDTSKLWVDTSVTPNVWKRYDGTAWIKCTPTELDEINDGATYARVKKTELSAGVIKLHSGTIKEGEWYKKTGVDIDATKGLRLYGGQIALITYPTEADMNADTNRQCVVDTDGKIKAGGGKVVLDAGGVKLQGENLGLYDDAWVHKGALSVGAVASRVMLSAFGGYILRLSCTEGDLEWWAGDTARSFVPLSNYTWMHHLGRSDKQWHHLHLACNQVATEIAAGGWWSICNLNNGEIPLWWAGDETVTGGTPQYYKDYRCVISSDRYAKLNNVGAGAQKVRCYRSG